jgi:hypothetical protein
MKASYQNETESQIYTDNRVEPTLVKHMQDHVYSGIEFPMLIGN